MIYLLPGEFLLNTNPELDAINTPEYLIQINVTDGSLSDVINLTVYVININDSPMFINLPNMTSLYEDLLTPVDIFEVVAVDKDKDLLTYSITSMPNGPFVVDNISKLMIRIHIDCYSTL